MLKKPGENFYPFFMVGAFSGDGISFLERPILRFDGNDKPYISLVPCVGFITEIYAKSFLVVLRRYFDLPYKKAKPGKGSFEYTARAKSDVKKVLSCLSDANHGPAHVHEIKVAQLNLLSDACRIRDKYGGRVRNYAELEALIAESFRIAFLAGTYVNRKYSYETITVAMAYHLGLGPEVCKSYSAYVNMPYPAGYEVWAANLKPVDLPKPKKAKSKPQDPRSKPIWAYGFYFPSLLQAEKTLKPMRAELEAKLNRRIKVDRKGLKQKLENPNDLDVVYG